MIRVATVTSRIFIIGGLLVSLAVAFFVSPLASGDPDGLERVAIDEGFGGSAEDHALGDSPLADYAVRGVEDEGLSTGLAGIAGTLATFGIGMLLFGGLRVARERRERATRSDAAAP